MSKNQRGLLDEAMALCRRQDATITKLREALAEACDIAFHVGELDGGPSRADEERLRKLLEPAQ